MVELTPYIIELYIERRLIILLKIFEIELGPSWCLSINPSIHLTHPFVHLTHPSRMPKTMRRHRAGTRAVLRGLSFATHRVPRSFVYTFVRSFVRSLYRRLYTDWSVIIKRAPRDILDSTMINCTSFVMSSEQLREYTVSAAKSMGCNDRTVRLRDLHRGSS